MIGVGGGAAMEKRKIWAMPPAGARCQTIEGEKSPHIKGFEYAVGTSELGQAGHCVVSAREEVGPIRSKTAGGGE
jgi:hypothetical protein